MVRDLAKRSRWFFLSSLVALAVAPAGCAADRQGIATDDGIGSSTDDITQVDHAKVKRQSIGNCWIYAVSGWAEALNKASVGTEANTSESWMTYWHWYDQLANGAARGEIQTGGWFGTGVDLLTRYGIVLEKDFIASEADAEMSNRQSTALDAVNASLKGGALKDAVARRDRKAIRAELDRAWQLDAPTIKRINDVFGDSVSRTLDRSSEAATLASANQIITTKSFRVKLHDARTREVVDATLADAIGKNNGWGPREGALAWNEATYPSDATSRRSFWKRVQRALHDNQPVVISWKVDFNALTSDSRFSLEELRRRGPGRQGGHMVLMHDYQAEVPGLGVLKAGETATPEQMEKALSDDTRIQFIRIKNSWGGIRPDRWNQASIAGYHDLELPYLDGPIKECKEVNGTSDPNDCPREVVPVWDVVLPAGY